MEKKRRATRARLLEAAHGVMVAKGVDAAVIRDITDKADIGFGTFYNYFESKDDLAAAVLDCMINGVGLRNRAVTGEVQIAQPDLAMAVSTRLLIRSAYEDSTWGWWVRRPDILADRLRAGLHPFVLDHVRSAIAMGIFHIADDNVEQVVAMLIWLVVGGMRDMLLGTQPPDADALITEGFMRVMGVSRRRAFDLANAPLPVTGKVVIDFSFGAHTAYKKVIKGHK